jgi:predicted RNA-binding Zn-ribbon protein involved in translation (DUF1610 family)
MIEGGRAPRLPERAQRGEPLDRFVIGAAWWVPAAARIDQVGEELLAMLVWSGEPPGREVRPGPGLFEDFLKLEAAKSDAAVLRYAERWGPLWLCSHQLPAGHAEACVPLDAIQFLATSGTRRTVNWKEPVGVWRAMSAEASSVVRIARQLHNGQLAREADWERLFYLPRVMWDILHTQFAIHLLDPQGEASEDQVVERVVAILNEAYRAGNPDDADDGIEPATPQRRDVVMRHGMRQLRSSLDVQRFVLGEVINYWLRMSSVEPRLRWLAGKPDVMLAGRGLFAALAVQLMFECSRTDGLAVCISCGTPFLPPVRRPRRDHNVYCPDCGVKAAQRDAAARYRQTAKYKATYGEWLKKRRGASE